MKYAGLILLMLLLTGAACSRTATPVKQSPVAVEPRTTTNNNPATTSNVTWEFTGTGWQANGTPPTCPIPFTLGSPTDVSSATSILYPGQIRGGDYKPHGGFRFDTINNNVVTVVSPIDGQVIRGARYIQSGEVQYLFDLVHPCGFLIRFDHMLELSPAFQAIADSWPAAQENDSRTNPIETRITVAAGDTIATKVGLAATGNTFFDLGVYDLRQKNSATADATYAANHSAELAQHAVCWLNMLPMADVNKISTLPGGDQTSGKSSDYCK